MFILNHLVSGSMAFSRIMNIVPTTKVIVRPSTLNEKCSALMIFCTNHQPEFTSIDQRARTWVLQTYCQDVLFGLAKASAN